MKEARFIQIVEARIRSYKKKLFVAKAAEYSRNDDRLHNFYAAAQMQNITPEEALRGMMSKHLVSIFDMINDSVKRHKIPDKGMIQEKFDDAINYLHLLEGLFEEKREKRNTPYRL